MTRYAVACAVALAAAAHAGIGAAQCRTDADCKGDRICDAGKCVAPPAPAAGASAQATLLPERRGPARRAQSGPIAPFGKGYVELDVTIGFGAFGQKRAESDDSAVQDEIEATGVDRRDASTGPYGGIYLAPRWAASERFHLGGYLRVGKGEDQGVRIEEPDVPGIDPFYDEDVLDNVGHLHFGVGASIKFGGMVGRRAWLGGGLDFGFHLTRIEDSEFLYVDRYAAAGADAGDDEKYVGFEVLPRLCVDILLFNFDGFKMSIPLSVGAAIIPYARWRPTDDDVEDAVDDEEVKVWTWQIEPVFMFGFAIGA